MLREKILQLKKRHNAVILAHNYADDEVQEIADFTGDSLELSIKARDAQAEVIVFAGVSFMAETAKILSPRSTVLLPVAGAGCEMAAMASAAAVREYRRKNPDSVLVAYVNTTAETKAEVDICCTSANAEKIVRSIPAGRKIMFLPDRNLGANIRNLTGREMDLWPGCCPVHDAVTPEQITAARRKNPAALVLVHPECRPEVVALADKALSTGQMLRFVRESSAREFVIGTENGIFHRLRQDNSGKIFVPLSPELTCANMKKITLEDILRVLENFAPQITLPEELITRARAPIDKMLAL